MSFKEYIDSIRVWIQSHQHETGILGLAILCFLSNFIMPVRSGGYVVLILGIILITILIGSMFLLFNTTILALRVMLKEGLSDVEKRWINIRLRRNLLIIMIWFVSVFLTFFMPKDQLGTIACLYLISILILFKVAGVEENPFLEQQKLH